MKNICENLIFNKLRKLSNVFFVLEHISKYLGTHSKDVKQL